MKKFQLVNPYIEGDFKTEYSGKTASDCAENVWDNLSGYLTGNVPKFAFTLQQNSNNKLHHFLVKEDVNDDLVNYSIKPLNIDLDKNTSSKLQSKIKKMSQSGGNSKNKKKSNKDDDDSSSSSTCSDDLDELYHKVMKKKNRHQTQPILYWWYTPSLYQYTVGSVFVPTFVVPLTPYVEIYPLSTAFWG